MGNQVLYLSYSSKIDGKGCDLLLKAFQEIVEDGVKEVHFLINTTGGTVDHGVNLYNILKGLPLELTTHNVSSVDSIGNIIFLAGKNRFACKHSNFLFHGVGLPITKAVRFEEKDLKEKIGALKSDNGILSSIISERTKLNITEIEEMFLKGVTMESEEAKTKGIVDDIREVQIPTGARFVQMVVKG